MALLWANTNHIAYFLCGSHTRNNYRGNQFELHLKEVSFELSYNRVESNLVTTQLPGNDHGSSLYGPMTYGTVKGNVCIKLWNEILYNVQ